MAEPAFKRQNATVVTAHEPIVIRRLEIPDLTKHGAWLTTRLVERYPHMTPQQVLGSLSSMLYNSEFLFLYQDDAVGLAQALSGNPFNPRPTVHEWFVYCRDPQNAEQVERAAAFYLDFVRWAKAKDAEAVIRCEFSDVPDDKIKGLRVFTKQQTFIKVQ